MNRQEIHVKDDNDTGLCGEACYHEDKVLAEVTCERCLEILEKTMNRPNVHYVLPQTELKPAPAFCGVVAVQWTCIKDFVTCEKCKTHIAKEM